MAQSGSSSSEFSGDSPQASTSSATTASPPHDHKESGKANPGKTRKRKQEDGRPYQRNGRTLGVLRKRYAAVESSLDLGPHASRSRLASESLAVALAHHLVAASGGILTVPNSPPLVDLTSTQRRIQRRGVHVRNIDPHQEVLLASLMALGSRRSFHSSITGPEGLHPGQTLEDVASLNIGAKREGACRLLAQRAVDLAERCDLLKDPSSSAQEAAAVLRVALFAVHPRHPFGAELAGYLHRLHQEREGMGTHPFFSRDGEISEVDCAVGPVLGMRLPAAPSGTDSLGLSVVEYDSYVAVLLRRPPKISETELSLLYGWDPNELGASLELLEGCKESADGSMQHPGRIVATFVLREIIKLQRRDAASAGKNIPKLQHAYARIYRCLNTMERVMAILYQDPNGDKVALAPHLGAIPMLAEVNLAFEAQRYYDSDKENEKLAALLETSKMRIVTWLGPYICFMNDQQFVSRLHGNHTRALLLSILDIYPPWIDLAVEAANQHASGVGRFAALGLSWNSLHQLRKSLLYASAVFGRSSRQKDDLSHAMANLSLGLTPTAVGAMAEGMVDCALSELA